MKFDDVITFRDLENHKDDTKIVPLAIIKLEKLTIKCKILAYWPPFFFTSSNVKFDDIVRFLDLENHKVDINNRSLVLIEVEI